MKQVELILRDDDLKYLHPEAEKFKQSYEHTRDGKTNKWTSQQSPRLREAYDEDTLPGLMSQLKFHLQGIHAHRDLSILNEKDQKDVSDLSYPTEWYPETRQMQRTIHLHVGPTNSGKTFHALQRLEQAESGVYAGPLRLLAYEVFTRLNAKGLKCDLVTGDEMQVSDDGEARMTSCTVEMVPQGRLVDVAVIDEIQMLGNKHRGWAWTQALLGVRAKEVHLCGEERAVPLLRELAVSMGDRLEVHHYKRLSPLKAMSSSLNGDLGNLRKGDCVICFSKRDLHATKNQIEKKMKKNVAIVYGSLPPESRAQQARLFNDPNNDYDYLVATDAIGMGLNLSIKRIIFDTTYKFNGKTHERISTPDLKQIAGRAGRYRVAPQNTTVPDVITPDAKVVEEPLDDLAAAVREKLMKPLDDLAAAVREKLMKPSSAKPIPAKMGKGDSDATTTGFVTSLEKSDLRHVQQALAEEAEPLMAAGIMPPDSVIIQFAAYFPPDTAFSYILYRLHELCRTKARYFLCDLRDTLRIAQALDAIPGLTITDRLTFCAAPTNAGNADSDRMIQALARCVAENKSGALLDIPAFNLELLDTPDSIANSELLTQFESLHKALILYTWLSYRFMGVFVSRDMAFHVKELVEARINKLLSDANLAEKRRKSKLKAMKMVARREEEQRERARLSEAADLLVDQNADSNSVSLEVEDAVSPPDASIEKAAQVAHDEDSESNLETFHQHEDDPDLKFDAEAVDSLATPTELVPDSAVSPPLEFVEGNSGPTKDSDEESTTNLRRFDGTLADYTHEGLRESESSAVNVLTDLDIDAEVTRTDSTPSSDGLERQSTVDRIPDEVLTVEPDLSKSALEESEDSQTQSVAGGESDALGVEELGSRPTMSLPPPSPPTVSSERSEQLM